MTSQPRPPQPEPLTPEETATTRTVIETTCPNCGHVAKRETTVDALSKARDWAYLRTSEDVLIGVDALDEDDLEPMGAIMRMVSREVITAAQTGHWSPKPIAEAILALYLPARAALGGATTPDLDAERLAEAILTAAGEKGRRPTWDSFEWYASADDMAADILAALTPEATEREP